jgi:hypothetical protein
MTGSNQVVPPIETLIEQFAPVAAELERISDALIDRIVEAIREEIPSYRTLGYRALRDAVSVSVRRGIEASRGNATPSAADLEEAAVIGGEAARFAIPVEGLLQATRIGVRIFWAESVEWATARKLDPTTLIAAAELIWRWADAMMAAFARGHREVSVAEAVELERSRSTFLFGVLQGSLAAPDLHAGAELHGLTLGAEYVPLRARAFSGARSPAHSERAIRHAFGPATEGILVCPLEDELVGVIPRRPVIDDPDVVVGLGRPAPLERIAPSYAEAVRAMEVANRCGLRGAFDLADLSLRAPLATEVTLGERLVARYLEPLRDGSHAGAELERTLRAYLDHGLRGEPAAQALHVHVNTLRNRLRRLEELVGGELRDPSRLAEIWWALEYDRIAGKVESES